ncbi:MAG: hypothetical protein ACKO6N_12420 [Myxococcota bacterium]
MKLLVVAPKTSLTIEQLSEAQRWYGFKSLHAPHALAQLAALTPSTHEVCWVDQSVGQVVDFQADVDVVVFVAAFEQLSPLSYLAGRFRARKVPTALAGSFVSAHPGRVDMVDHKLIGPLETVWPLFLQQFSAGVRERVFRGPALESLHDLPAPRWDAFPLSAYRMGTVEVVRELGPLDPDSLEEGRTGRLYQAAARVVEQVETLAQQGMRRIHLAGPDLLASVPQGLSVLQALAAWNAARKRPVKFEAHISLNGVKSDEVLRILVAAHVRRVVLPLNAPEPAQPESHETLLQAAESVRRMLAHGIRVAGRLYLGRAIDDARALEEQVALARDGGAILWPRVAKTLPGTPLYERLKAQGRVFASMREARLDILLLDAPNFKLPFVDKEGFLAQLRSLLQTAYSPLSLELRLRKLYEEAEQYPPRGAWLELEDVQALLLCMAGTLKHPEEARLEQVARAVALTAVLRPHPRLWSQGLEQVIEEAATRSYVLKTLHEQPLDSEVPEQSFKQKLVGMGARLVGKLGPKSPVKQASEA